MKKESKKKGYTLIELVIIIAVIAILVTAIATSVILVYNKKAKEAAKETVYQNMQSIVTAIQKRSLGFYKSEIEEKGAKNYFGLSDSSHIKEIEISLTDDNKKIKIVVTSNKKEKDEYIKSETTIENNIKGKNDMPITILVQDKDYKLIWEKKVSL